ncbi:3-oxoacyl-[acyl-carrier-protein] reductase FabG [Neolewinella maritima]|uniref:3-oxoacyl-[acyl-carrier-protein] reductase FabG n=1 Tax=Neolewinella maritima TaxID=1383882 RepID=A0ABM9AX26_9BACT|nr:SDR family oxidoreductase [Neolewinella maritima]CAH0998700.1 3-oxoacyl-[acyl-carrier-protein] reductase FabG [Neolewinella maritima]
MDLTGKTAIVTGGSRDIGRAICVKLGALGANVVVNYFSSEQDGKDTVSDVNAAGGKGLAVRADMTKQEDVERLVQETRTAFGNEIHYLVNNAGGLVARKKLAEMDLDFWNKLMTLNLTSVFLAHKAVVPHMPSGSAIVNLTSLAGRDGGGGGASAYATSKGALMTFTRSMAKELGPDGIRVNGVCPGMIATTFHDTFTPDNVREMVAGKTPLRRQGGAKEVADLVAVLLSDASSFVTGANVDINGGLAFS